MQNYRLAFEGSNCLLPEVVMVGCADIKLARIPGLIAHLHPNAYELFYLERGETDWWVENEVVTLKANHVYVNKPGEKHGSVGPSLKPCSYYWIQLVFAPGKRLPGVSPAQSRAWEKELAALNPRSFPGNPELRDYFERMFVECQHPQADSVIIARSILHLLLGTLLRLNREQKQGATPRPCTSYAIRNALKWIDDNLTEPIPIEKLARVAKLGVSRFRERFFDEVGFSPNDYLVRRRIDEAKKKLEKSSVSIIEIAHEVGFSSSQYFATVFKRMEGVSPGDFRARLDQAPMQSSLKNGARGLRKTGNASRS